jgi:hypothetical protein
MAVIRKTRKGGSNIRDEMAIRQQQKVGIAGPASQKN